VGLALRKHGRLISGVTSVEDDLSTGMPIRISAFGTPARLAAFVLGAVGKSLLRPAEEPR
jgi:hypothetical protein